MRNTKLHFRSALRVHLHPTTERRFRKRANGGGCVYQRKDGRYVAAITMPNGLRVPTNTGRARRPMLRFAR